MGESRLVFRFHDRQVQKLKDNRWQGPKNVQRWPYLKHIVWEWGSDNKSAVLHSAYRDNAGGDVEMQFTYTMVYTRESYWNCSNIIRKLNAKAGMEYFCTFHSKYTCDDLTAVWRALTQHGPRQHLLNHAQVATRTCHVSHVLT